MGLGTFPLVLSENFGNAGHYGMIGRWLGWAKNAGYSTVE